MPADPIYKTDSGAAGQRGPLSLLEGWPTMDELLVTMPKACPYCRALPDCTPTCITRLAQTPHDTEAPGGGRPTFGHASVRRNGHDGDAGRSAASLAETAAPIACPDDVCRAQGSCAWDCGGRKYVP